MFEDMSLSEDLNIACAQQNEAWSRQDPQCRVRVLSTGVWPSEDEGGKENSAPNLSIPPIVRAKQADFGKFYASKYEGGRKLTYQYRLATCVIEGQFASGTKELHLPAY